MMTHWGSKGALRLACLLAVVGVGCKDGNNNHNTTDASDASHPSDASDASQVQDASDGGTDASDASQPVTTPFIRLAHFGWKTGSTTTQTRVDAVHACYAVGASRTLLTVDPVSHAPAEITFGTISSYVSFAYYQQGTIELYPADGVTLTPSGPLTLCAAMNGVTPIATLDLQQAALQVGQHYTLALVGHGGTEQCLDLDMAGAPSTCTGQTGTQTNPPAAPRIVKFTDDDATAAVVGQARVRVIQADAFFPALQVCYHDYASDGGGSRIPLLGAGSKTDRSGLLNPYSNIAPLTGANVPAGDGGTNPSVVLSAHVPVQGLGDCPDNLVTDAGVQYLNFPTGSLPQNALITAGYNGQNGAALAATTSLEAGKIYTVFVYQTYSAQYSAYVPLIVAIQDTP